MHRLVTAGMLALLLAFTAPALAQDYPTQPIKVIVPYAAGGGTDIAVRIVAEEAAAVLGQSLVVDNRGGGGTVIGTAAIASARPDGYTIGFVDPAFTINPSLIKKLPYDSQKDFIPVVLATTSNAALTVNAASPHKDLKSFVAYIKANPGKVNFASPGRGSAGHLGSEQFKLAIDAQMAHVPYRGGAPALQDLLAGQVDALFVAPNALLPLINAGQLRPLAITNARSPMIPSLPTFAEQGVPHVDMQTFAGMLAPAGTPPAIVTKLREAINASLKSPKTLQRLAELDLNAVGGTSEAFADYLATTTEKWRKVVVAAKIESEP